MEEMAPMLAMVVMFGATVQIVRSVQQHRRLKQLAEYQYNLHHELLEKFGSSQDMLNYLESDAGKKLVDLAPAEKIKPHAKILSSIQNGIILALAGGAFYLMRTQINDAFEEFTFMGVLGMALGIGFLVSAVVAYVLSKSWGLLNGHNGSNDDFS